MEVIWYATKKSDKKIRKNINNKHAVPKVDK